MKKYLFESKKYIIAQILWDLIGVICLAISPLLQQWLFDNGINCSFKIILLLVLAYFALLLFYTLSQFFCVLYAFKGGIKFEKLLKRDFLYTLLHSEPTKFYSHAIGEYISLQGNDITALEQDYLEPIISTVRCVNMMIVYGIVLFVGVDWRIALVIILTSILAIWIPRLIGNSLTKSRSAYQEQMAEYVTTITDLLEGFRIVNHVTVGKILDRHENVLDETSEKRYQYGKKKSLVLGASELMTKLVKIITFGVTAILFYKKEITVGTGVATLSYVSSFIEPIDSVLYNITTIQSMTNVKKKVLSFIKIDKIAPIPKKTKLDSEIALKNITYRRDKFVLDNINLTIKKGKKYAIVGQSGAGKSTLLKIIMGFEKINSGVINIDGEDIRNYDISELISYTDQNEHIFRAGIDENITVFNSYDVKGISNAKYNINTELFKDIFKRKDKECQNFSGGEKQAISFFRMIAKNAEIILMDEPFSAMDVKTKAAVGQYMFTDKEFENKTVLMVTHDVREESLSLFDGIIYVEKDRVYLEKQQV